MEVKGKEKHLVNASIYLENAILELKQLPCKCTQDNILECSRCPLIEDIEAIREDVNKELSKILEG